MASKALRDGVFKSLGVLALVSASADFYVRHYYWGLPQDEGEWKLFFVDATEISKPCALTCTRMNPSYRKHTIFAPRNGAVVRAREVEGHPAWLQLPPGDYVERRLCGIEVLKEIDEAKLPRKMVRNVQYFSELLPKKQTQQRKTKKTASSEAAPPSEPVASSSSSSSV